MGRNNLNGGRPAKVKTSTSINDLMQYEKAYGGDIEANLDRINGKQKEKICTYMPNIESKQCGQKFMARRGQHYCGNCNTIIEKRSQVNGDRTFQKFGFRLGDRIPYMKTTIKDEINWL